MLLQSLVHPVRTMEQLNKQRESSIFTDITILVAGEKFSAHRALLAAHSPVFKQVLEDTSFAQENPNINLDGVEPLYFAILLDFLYTSKLAVDLTNVDQVSATSKFLQVLSVVELCTKFKEANKKIECDDKESTDDDVINHQSYEDDVGMMNCDADDHEDDLQDNQLVKCEQIEVQVTDEGQTLIRNETNSSLSSLGVPLTNDNQSMSGYEKGQRKRGRKLVMRVECPHCFKVMTRARLTSHIRSHTKEKTVKCNICGKAFANIYNLKIHARKHTGEKPYKCPLCPRVYSDPSSLCKHKLWHAGVKKKKCGVCGRLFSTMSHVTEHMRTHTKERPFICHMDNCGKDFSYKCDLTRHMREHTGDMLGPCKYCGKTFTHQGNYKAHLRVHESRKTEKVRLGSETFFISANGSNNAVTLTSQSADLDQDTPERAIVKVADLAELMVQGHELEVMINDGKLVVKQPMKEGDEISLQHDVGDEVISVNSDVINVDANDGQLVVVDQIIEPTYSNN